MTYGSLALASPFACSDENVCGIVELLRISNSGRKSWWREISAGIMALSCFELETSALSRFRCFERGLDRL
jgi:hypothetical protein